MPGQILRLNWHPPGFKPRLVATVIGLTGAGCLMAGLWQAILPLLIFGLLFLAAAGFFLVQQETIVDGEARQLVLEGRRFGRFCLWRRRYPLSEFAAVTCRRVIRAGEAETIFVGLRRITGRIMEVGYFNRGADYSQARSLADRLVEATGLPVEEMKS